MGLVTFYSILMYILSVIVGVVELRKKEFLYILFPYLFGQGYWFFTMYLELFLLMPLLSVAVENANKKYLQTMIISFLMFLSILPYTMGSIVKVNDFGMSTISWYVLVWMIGAYLRKHGSKMYSKISMCKILLLMSSILMCLASVGVLLIEKKVITVSNSYIVTAIQILGNHNANAVLPVLISVLLLIVFQNLNIKQYQWIYKMSVTTFGIYLLHDNRNFASYMWTELCGTVRMMNSEYFVLYSMACIILVFVCCYLIERLRMKIVERGALFWKNTIRKNAIFKN